MRADGPVASPARSIVWTAWHPVVAAVVPVLVLWGANVTEVPVIDGMRLASTMAAVGVVTWGAFGLLLRSLGRGALAATPVLLAFSLVGLLPLAPVWQLVALAVVAVAGLAVASPAALASVGRLSIVFFVGLGAAAVANAGLIVSGQRGAPADPLVGELAVADDDAGSTALDSDAADTPDVWVVVPDRYPASRTLARRGIDSTAMVDSLEQRGFRVLDDATSNYPETLLSLGSAWNLQLFEADGAQGDDIKRQAVPAIDQHQFGQLFQQAGYRYVHIGPWSGFSARPSIADEVLTLGENSELSEVWIGQTAMSSAMALAGLDFDVAGRHRRHALFELAALDDLASEPSGRPELVMAHVILPHEPYVFGVDGGAPTAATELQAYDDQRRYFDTRLLDLVDTLLARDEPPTILIASDEGLYPEDWTYVDGAQYDWSSVSPVQARDKFSILAAVRTPDFSADDAAQGSVDNPVALDDDATLVNIMRWIANDTVGAGLDQLPDEHYLYRSTGWTDLGAVDLDGPSLD